MTEETIFNEEIVSPSPEITTKAIPPELDSLVGTGKKYATVDAALAAMPHAQSHISKLETELASMREELTKRKTTQELLDEIKSGIPQTATTNTVEFDQDLVAQIVQQQLSQKEVENTAKGNMKVVANTFTDKFGTDAEKIYNALALDSGLSVAALNQLAATSPAAVLKMAGISKTQPPVGRISSDINTQVTQSNAGGELSAKVGKGNSTKDVALAWKIAGEKAKQELGLT